MKNYNYILLISVVLLSACSKKVLVGTSDSNPPIAVISTLQKGLITTTTSEETTGKTVQALEETDLFFVARGKDTLGIKALAIEVVQNGNFDINGTLYPLHRIVSPNIDSVGMGRDLLFLSGILRPDTPNNEMVIRAKSEDHANNTSITPAIRIQFIKKAEGRISANRSRIDRGESVTINYESDNATKVSINNTTLNTLSGSITYTPQQTTQYILKAENNLSEDLDTITIRVNQPPSMPSISNFTAAPINITQGQSSNLSWTTQNTSNISISPIGYNSNNSSGSKTVSPSSSTTYTLTASGPGGSISSTTQVNVSPPVSSIECFTTPHYSLSFSFYGNINGVYVYNMNLSNETLYNRKSITKITNKSTAQVRLWTGGNFVIINPNQSTTAFNGLNVARGWTLESAISLFSVQIEFCYESF